MPQQYPFSAVVGSTAAASPGAGSDLTDMALSLILTTISPEVGGVLVRGEKGTAKSTIVRALAAARPRALYRTGKFARRMAALSLLPAPLLDPLRRRLFGLPAPGSLSARAVSPL